jgi:serine/threonine protein kinase
MDDLIGRTIAEHYRVETFLGKGGMAEVYKVWDQERSVHLAMKILHADLAEDKVFLRRFKREAQTLAKLQHPNIVRFYGLERADGLVFILMDYVEGITLRKEIFETDKPLSQERIVELMRPICAALNYAHKSGFIHCDVKPANIMIDKGGKVYISDFGIARMTEAATMTMVGAGTPAYMAPEQARGEDPVPQTDIYALGVILFEMLTGGERPFTGESAQTTGSTSEKVRWEQIRLPAPPPSKFNPSITQSMDEIVLKCLAKSSSSRYLNATDLLNDLMREFVQVNVPIQPVPVSIPVPEQPKDEKAQQSIPQPKKPVIAPSVEKAHQPVVKSESRHNTRSLMVLGVIGIGILGILVIIATSVGVAYQKNMKFTATAEAKNMQATATKQAQNARTTATKQAQNAQITKTAETVFGMVPQEIASRSLKVRLFDSFSSEGDWVTGPEDNSYWAGNQVILSGTYTWKVDDVYQFFVWRKPIPNISIRDFYFQIDIKRIVGAKDHACYGLSFRDTNNGYYFFEICDDQSYKVSYYSYLNGWVDVSGWDKFFSKNSNGMNRLGVSALGDRIDIYINSIKVYSFADELSAGRGDLGMVIELNAKEAAAFEFDNVIVLEP